MIYFWWHAFHWWHTFLSALVDPTAVAGVVHQALIAGVALLGAFLIYQGQKKADQKLNFDLRATEEASRLADRLTRIADSMPNKNAELGIQIRRRSKSPFADETEELRKGHLFKLHAQEGHLIQKRLRQLEITWKVLHSEARQSTLHLSTSAVGRAARQVIDEQLKALVDASVVLRQWHGGGQLPSCDTALLGDLIPEATAPEARTGWKESKRSQFIAIAHTAAGQQQPSDAL
jgi:hypothetical protein